MKKVEKTNVERILDQKKIEYIPHSYIEDSTLTASDIASVVGIEVERVFKTLVTVSDKNHYYVFILPANGELDLKKGAKVVNEKSISMVKMKDLLPLTGYVHGGCSPIGMKKYFPTYIDESCLNFEKIAISAGKVGKQIEISLSDLQKVIKITTADLKQ